MKKYGDHELVARAKASLYRRLAKHPRLLALARGVHYALWRSACRLRKLARSPQAVYDPDELLLVDPQKIVNCAAMQGSTCTIRGCVADGDWDIQRLPFSGWDVYKAFEDRFVRRRPWEATAYYERVLAEIRGGRTPWGCNSVEAFHRRLELLEQLFERIAKEGYKAQAQIQADGEDRFAWDAHTPFKAHDEVVVCIGRHGDLLFRDGKHRLSIAKILKLPAIPVAVGLRHRLWHNFREELLAYARANGGRVYQPLTHPDLRCVPAQHDDGRFDIMFRHIPPGARTVLDLGSHWGYFCHRFEERGFECTAVENHPRHVYFLRKLRRAEDRQFKIMDCSVLELGGPQCFDVVLALNIFHHFLRTESTYNALWDFIARLDAKVMFFETANKDEPVMRDAAINPDPDDFVDMILARSSFRHARQIAVVARGRRLYVLER